MKHKLSVSLDSDVWHHIDKIARHETTFTHDKKNMSNAINYLVRSTFSKAKYLDFLKQEARLKYLDFMSMKNAIDVLEDELTQENEAAAAEIRPDNKKIGQMVLQ